jgi:hypothetical protein
MNKKVIIISVLGLLGLGAFLYFKPKSKAQDEDSSTGGALGSNSGNTDLSNTTGVPPTDNVSTTPEQVQETSPASLSDLQAIVYLIKYPDLNSAFNGNLLRAKEHWISLGKSEKRTIPLIKNSVSSPAQLSDEQAMIYLSKYPDLLMTFGVNLDLAKQHWVNLGNAEKRTIDVVI